MIGVLLYLHRTPNSQVLLFYVVRSSHPSLSSSVLGKVFQLLNESAEISIVPPFDETLIFSTKNHQIPITGVCPDLIITVGQALVLYEIKDSIKVATITCLKPKRYALIGGKEVTCQSDDTWSATPECRLCGTDYFT